MCRLVKLRETTTFQGVRRARPQRSPVCTTWEQRPRISPFFFTIAIIMKLRLAEAAIRNEDGSRERPSMEYFHAEGNCCQPAYVPIKHTGPCAGEGCSDEDPVYDLSGKGTADLIFCTSCFFKQRAVLILQCVQNYLMKCKADSFLRLTAVWCCRKYGDPFGFRSPHAPGHRFN